MQQKACLKIKWILHIFKDNFCCVGGQWVTVVLKICKNLELAMELEEVFSVVDKPKLGED